MAYSINVLGKKLREMYDNAPDKEQVLMIHLFGIKYASDIKANNYTAKEIVKAAGINESYQAEVSKGMRMAKYVEIKQGYDNF